MLINWRVLMLLVSYYGFNGRGWDIVWKVDILIGDFNVLWIECFEVCFFKGGLDLLRIRIYRLIVVV